ncbi:NAD(P)(+) transhydrogenase (Re/Si-specific) subunit alpha, partial [Candidatus Pelagibacter sp.]|nr:NAD(P)(+) transhydrogenase (Re/Si-specific) subunit alpha [Candidatus Pelagibacter sp.]
MKIGSIKENLSLEQRIAVTPEIIKKYKSLDLNIILPKGYGNHLGISDKEFSSQGAEMLDDDDKVLSEANLIIQMNLIDEKNFEKLKSEQIIIGVLNPFFNNEKLKYLLNKKINCFSLELLPRITRAQSMDILSSQANLAGYKSVVDSFSYYQKAIPMMMTAAGTIPAAKVLVVGAGVAGLQAIATAKRMGAIVFATDVRLASKEQVESLGGKFLIVEGAENLETEGGYAKETSPEFKQKQENLLKETLK